MKIDGRCHCADALASVPATEKNEAPPYRNCGSISSKALTGRRPEQHAARLRLRFIGETPRGDFSVDFLSEKDNPCYGAFSVLKYGQTPFWYLEDKNLENGDRRADRGWRGRRQNGVARKWRRNALKRLNPRPEMVWARKPRSHNIWYASARLTVRSGEWSRTAAYGKAATVHEFEAQEGRAKKLQKKAPNALKSLDAECHARESGHPDLAARAGALDSRFRGNDTADLIFE